MKKVYTVAKEELRIGDHRVFCRIKENKVLIGYWSPRTLLIFKPKSDGGFAIDLCYNFDLTYELLNRLL
jgi:hypothetical protein